MKIEEEKYFIVKEDHKKIYSISLIFIISIDVLFHLF